MTKRSRQAMRKAYASWCVHTGYTNGDHNRRNDHGKIEFRTQAACREWVQHKTEDERVAWITVYPPVRNPDRKVYRWTRHNGWKTTAA